MAFLVMMINFARQHNNKKYFQVIEDEKDAVINLNVCLFLTAFLKIRKIFILNLFLKTKFNETSEFLYFDYPFWGSFTLGMFNLEMSKIFKRLGVGWSSVALHENMCFITAY